MDVTQVRASVRGSVLLLPARPRPSERQDLPLQDRCSDSCFWPSAVGGRCGSRPDADVRAAAGGRARMRGAPRDGRAPIARVVVVERRRG